MSWQDYVDKQLVGSGNVKTAAIAGLDGQIWAASAGFGVTPAECLTMANAFKDNQVLIEKGLYVAGTKYFYLSGSDEVLRGKKGAGGLHIAKTNTAIIVAHYDDPIQPAQCATTVEALAEYLKSANI